MMGGGGGGTGGREAGARVYVLSRAVAIPWTVSFDFETFFLCRPRDGNISAVTRQAVGKCLSR